MQMEHQVSQVPEMGFTAQGLSDLTVLVVPTVL